MVLFDYLKSEKYLGENFSAEEFPWDECVAKMKADGAENPEAVCAAIKNRTVKHSLDNKLAKDAEEAVANIILKAKEDKLYAYSLEKLAKDMNPAPVAEAHIYVNGVIGSYEEEGKQIKGVELLDIISQVQKNATAKSLIVHITSPGGSVDEGYAIHDYLKGLGKHITTIIEGQCASIATIIALAGDKRIMIEGSEFMIHNPWASVEGDADHLSFLADSIRDTEKQMIDFYYKKTGISKEGIDGLMKKETRLTPEQAMELKFVTDVVGKIKTFAINPKKNQNMSKVLERLEKLAIEVKAIAKKVFVKAIDMKSKEGAAVHFDTEEEIAAGVVVTVDGNPAPDATITLEDGRVVTTDAESKVKEIAAAASQEEMMKQEIAALKKTNEDLKAENEKFNEVAKSLEEKVFALQKDVKSTYTPARGTQSFAKGVSGNEKSISERAAERKSEYKKK